MFRLRSPPEIDACIQSPEGATPHGTFRIARAPSARYIGHVSNVSRADDPDEGSPAEEGPPDRVCDARSPAPRRSARTTREAPRRVAGVHPGPLLPPLPAGEGGLSTSLGLGAPPALFGQRLADRARVAPTRRGPCTSRRISVSFWEAPSPENPSHVSDVSSVDDPYACSPA